MNVPWTQFWDMHSGGGQKEPWAQIFIQAPEAEAKVVFYNRFGHNPERVTCTCCGPDYSISEYPSLEAATAYHRGCDYEGDTYVERPQTGRYAGLHPYQTLEQYLASGEVHVIRAEEIKPEERVGDIPEQGYVWIG